MKKGTFATHWWDRAGGLAPLCGTKRRSGPLRFAMRPTCRICRHFLLKTTHGLRLLGADNQRRG